MLGLFCLSHNFLLPFQLFFLGFNFIPSNGQLLLGFTEMLVLVLGLLLNTSQGSLNTFPLSVCLGQPHGEVLVLFSATTRFFMVETQRASSSFSLEWA